MVEQQAEISAWIVLRNFGFNMRAARNYVGCWGGNDENCVKVFDTVANVATFIIGELENKLSSPIKEGINIFENTITGQDIAELLGGKVLDSYEKGKLKLQQQEITENFHRFLNRMEESGKDAITPNMFRL